MAISTEDFVKQIETMTVLDLANLVKALEDRFGVSAAAAAVAAPAAAGPAAAAAPAEEQTEFTVVLTEVGDKKINVIKAVREVTSLGLNQRHQGGPRGHLARPEGSEGPRRGRSSDREGRRLEGRGREDQEGLRRGRRQGHRQVTGRRAGFSPPRDGLKPVLRRSGRCSCIARNCLLLYMSLGAGEGGSGLLHMAHPSRTPLFVAC
jgi:large subunit ribosomal protein L7/L12